MKTYYAVATSIFSGGRVVCNLVDCIQAVEKPTNAFKSTCRADYYIDYFDTEEEAMQFVAEARKA